MLWRVRTTLPDQPGALATFAARCGDARVNILGLQIFPQGGVVVDEFILETLPSWSPAEVAHLMLAAGGKDSVVQLASKAALEDQPTRYVEAARSIIANPMVYPEVLAELFDAEREPIHGSGDVLETTVSDVEVQIHRHAPFTGTERARGAALAALVDDVMALRPVTVAPAPGLEPEYVIEGNTAYAWIAGTVVGSAIVEGRIPDPDGDLRPISLSVDGAWQRRGIGRRLLVNVARLAKALGADEILLTTSAENPSVLPMVLAAGLRGRIRMAGDQLTVRVSVRELRPLPAP